MRDVLVHMEKYRNAHGIKEESGVFGVIKALIEGAASIDEWNHVPAIGKFPLYDIFIAQKFTRMTRTTGKGSSAHRRYPKVQKTADGY